MGTEARLEYPIPGFMELENSESTSWNPEGGHSDDDTRNFHLGIFSSEEYDHFKKQSSWTAFRAKNMII